MERAVLEQLNKSLSIRDNSGVIGDLERLFMEYHSRSHGLLSNSGTSAILSMFEGLGIGPGDEVIGSVYSFHASVSPAVYLGAEVRFADVDIDGGISAESLAAVFTDRTRAVVITHLWGLPCRDLARVAALCASRGVALLEDCSHAHGARLDGELVGTHGRAAAWSLQGQKVVSGGEGGIMLTDDRGLFERAVLQGHYNRRTRDEIDRSSELWAYHQTGLGLKLRAHPLGAAVALEQFRKLDDFLNVKNEFADTLAQALADYPFLELPRFGSNSRPSWYAFPIRFYSGRAGGVSRERFVEALHAEGLVEVDIPSSTNNLAHLPLFADPGRVLQRRATSTPGGPEQSFPGAAEYASRVLKLPVWGRRDDRWVIDAYIEGLRKVADHVASQGL
jgi:perosamine synthetase